MIILAALAVLIAIVNAIFSFLPLVETLPQIGGFDIDASLMSGIGGFQTFITAIWPLYDVWLGFLFLMSYYAIKMLLKFFLGHRAPGSH